MKLTPLLLACVVAGVQGFHRHLVHRAGADRLSSLRQSSELRACTIDQALNYPLNEKAMPLIKPLIKARGSEPKEGAMSLDHPPSEEAMHVDADSELAVWQRLHARSAMRASDANDDSEANWRAMDDLFLLCYDELAEDESSYEDPAWQPAAEMTRTLLPLFQGNNILLRQMGSQPSGRSQPSKVADWRTR